MKDEQLALELKKKNQEALEKIIEKYTPLVSAVINNIAKGLLTPSDIEEAAADVFYALWVNSDKVSSSGMKGYICSIAKTKAKDKLRKLELYEELDPDDSITADEFSFLNEIDNRQLHDDIEKALLQFGSPDREILIRYYYYYQTAQKISELTGLKLENVKSRIKRARPKLIAFLKERGH